MLSNMKDCTKKTPKLIVISAPSGAGKSTLCNLVVENNNYIKYSISCTTRKPRGDEKHGVHYYFISDDEFKKNIANGNFLEYAKVHDYFYGTLHQTIFDSLSNGFNIILDIDVQGAANIRKIVSGNANLYNKENFIDIFIHPPSLKILEQRLIERGVDSNEQIRMRLKNAKKEIAMSDNFCFQIVNDDLSNTYLKLMELLETKC